MRRQCECDELRRSADESRRSPTNGAGARAQYGSVRSSSQAFAAPSTSGSSRARTVA